MRRMPRHGKTLLGLVEQETIELCLRAQLQNTRTLANKWERLHSVTSSFGGSLSAGSGSSPN